MAAIAARALGVCTPCGARLLSPSSVGHRACRKSSVAVAAAATSQARSDYSELCTALREITALSSISGLLGWDQETMMPPGGTEARGSASGALSGVVHEKRTSPRLGQLLAAVEQVAPDEWSPKEAAVLRESRRAFDRATKIPKELAVRQAKLSVEANKAWVDARQRSDWSAFSPFLRSWVELIRETAACVDPSADPYEVCLDAYEKGITTSRLDEVFAQLKADIVPLLKEIHASPVKPANLFEDDSKRYNLDAQAQVCKDIAVAMGFCLQHGRIDVSVHPFTGGPGPTDVRMTTRFKAHDPLEGVTGVIHETGHALYEQGRDTSSEHAGLPVTEAHSMGIHESQSLLWERMVGLSAPFCSYAYPLLSKSLGVEGGSAGELYETMNRVKRPSLIRVEADEVSYPLHILLRYELERELLSGSLDPVDVPLAWAVKMRDYLGEEVPDDASGALQDVHWSYGLFGYFPTYALGAVYAAQIYACAARQVEGLDGMISRGEFGELRGWLRENVHQVGSLHASSDELMVALSGRPLQSRLFTAYLRGKYSKLYKL